jgi:hypothetical protein
MVDPDVRDESDDHDGVNRSTTRRTGAIRLAAKADVRGRRGEPTR